MKIILRQVYNLKWLILIILLASFLRLWDLPNNPSGLTWDEVALGYNAYSILKTGRDEYGHLLPLTLKSFGDYKPALYAYLDIPFVAFLGLNELSVRLPSALIGILCVGLIYFLAQELFNNKRLSLLCSLFLAISPWHIQFSRPAFEVNLALFLNLLAVYLFIKGFKLRKLLIFSSLFFGLSIFTYQGSKIFVPLLILVILISYRKSVSLDKLKLPALILGIFILVLGLTTVLGNQAQRLSTLNFFAYTRPDTEIQMISQDDGLRVNSLPFQILHGEWFSYVRGLTERYLIYFSPKQLFVEGDYSQRHRVPDLGILYYFSVILIPLGLIFLLKIKDRASKLIFLWLILAPIPAVFSRDLISTLRALNMVIPVAILEAAGFLLLTAFLRKMFTKWSALLIGIVWGLMLFNVLVYLDRYFIHAPLEYSKYWLYGYKQVFNKLPNTSLYNKVVISDAYGQPYIYYLFYIDFPSEKFQAQAKLDQPTVDVGTIRKIDNIEFRHIYWPKDRGEKNALFIGPKEELPDQDILPFPEYKLLNDINFLDGEHAFRIVETI